MGEIRVALGNEGQLIDVSPRVLGGRCSREVYDLQRQLNPLLPVTIVPVAYDEAKAAYDEDGRRLRLERTDTGATVVLSDMIMPVGDDGDFCFVGLVGNQVMTVIVERSYDQSSHGDIIAKVYNWPDSAEQAATA